MSNDNFFPAWLTEHEELGDAMWFNLMPVDALAEADDVSELVAFLCSEARESIDRHDRSDQRRLHAQVVGAAEQVPVDGRGPPYNLGQDALPRLPIGPVRSERRTRPVLAASPAGRAGGVDLYLGSARHWMWTCLDLSRAAIYIS